MLFADLLGRFEGVTSEADGGHSALCPAHQDSRPSLRIWRGSDGKVRLTCRAGCDTADVIRAVGLGWSDLFDVTGPGAVVAAGRPQLVPVAQTAALAAYADRCSLALADFAGEWPERARTYLSERFGLDLDTAAELGLGVDDGHQGGTSPTCRAATALTRG
ncbi:hypothetical protein [Streptomyces griseus]|uniref:hypothetical protein n=1 Tax=Streptomyces griseus TaxID=1911 RepID=UPI003650819E